MSSWKQDDLRQIASTDDLHIAPLRDDGVTYGTLTWIWSVVLDDSLYVRAYNGMNSSWHKAALAQMFGKITATGKTFEVAFEAVTGELNDRIDAAYKVKYGSSSYLKPMISDRARSATVRISPKT